MMICKKKLHFRSNQQVAGWTGQLVGWTGHVQEGSPKDLSREELGPSYTEFTVDISLFGATSVCVITGGTSDPTLGFNQP